MQRFFSVFFSSVAILFVLVFAGTYVAPDAYRPFVTERTDTRIEEFVSQVEMVLNTPDLETWLGEPEIAAARNELDRYRTNPEAYVAEVADMTPENTDSLPTTLSNAVKSVEDLLRMQTNLKLLVHLGHHQPLADFITNLRIISATNAALALVVLGLAYVTRGTQRVMVRNLSFVLIPAIIGSTGISYYWLVTTTLWIGWFYPILLSLVSMAILFTALLEYFFVGLLVKDKENIPESS